MKHYTYFGTFKSSDGHIYTEKVYCNGFLQAFFLLTADAIRSGRHYQLYTITDENDKFVSVGDILACSKLLS